MNIFKKTKLWRGLSGLLIALMMLVIFAAVVLFQYESVINAQFGITTSVAVSKGESDVDTNYYPSDFGEINADNLNKLEAAAYEQTVKEAEEGAVLLKNAEVGGKAALPLDDSERKVSLFGRATYEPLYKTSAACTRVIANNPELIVDLRGALKAADFDVNETLYNAYANGTGKETLGFSYGFEEPIGFYEAQASSLSNYKQLAIVMLTRSGGEGIDMSVDQSLRNGAANAQFPADGVKNSLALQKNEIDMLKFVKAQGFAKTIVLINTNYQMELDWVDDPDYGIDACLYVGTVGLKGLTGVVNILTGDVAPSGKLVDTYAASSLSSPAIVNACGNTPMWSNVDTYRDSGVVKDYKAQTGYVSVQQENIYVGYKYYETRYADAIDGDAGASSSVGAFKSDGGWNYADEVVYPFGFGLSYTDFKQTIEKVEKGDDGKYTVSVRVENIGSTPAKSVVQIYASTPYGDYEKQRKIEKSAIQLVAFDKTDTVMPGAANAVTTEITVDPYLFASYDHTDTKGYVLTAGEYYFAIGNGAHEALNNVLAAKGKTGLIDHDGNAFTVKQNVAYKFDLDLDTESYRYGEGGEESGVAVTNKFEKMDVNYWEGNSVKYLTRSDWAGTFPVVAASVKVNAGEMSELLQGEFYKKPENAKSTSFYAQGKNNNWKGVDHGLPFVSMRNVEADNDEVWNMFIDQFGLDQLVLMTGNYFGNKPIEPPVNLPEKSGGDGCQGVGDEPYATSLTDGKVLWPCLYTSMLASSFSPELLKNRGKLMANQALFLNQTVIWTGGGNLHRTPYSGRQAEYYSEDANYTYLASSLELKEMQSRGVIGGIKHFAANDQETQREGLNVFYLEQAHREGALRGFEGAVRIAKVNAVMNSFNRQGVVYSSSCYELNVNVLREEWGFKGQVITDASSGATSGYKSHYTTSIANGTDLYCLDGKAVGGGIIAAYIKESDDGYMLECLRNAARHSAYALSRSAAINGLADDTEIVHITPGWKIAVIVVMVIVIVIALGASAMFALCKVFEKKNGGNVDERQETDRK